MAFAGYLQANTAADILIGPFIDDTDGKTPETGLTIDVELSKNGQALANKNDATDPVHDAAGDIDGYYNCELDSTDTNTEGMLTVVCFAAGALPVRLDFMVLAQAAYASLVTAKDTGYMDVNTRTITADAIDASAIKADAGAEIADAILDRNMATGADSGSATVRTVRQALRFLRNKWTLTGTTLSVKKEDDSTESWAATTTTDAAAVPIIGNDPASV
jgi:hypothetical protein